MFNDPQNAKLCNYFIRTRSVQNIVSILCHHSFLLGRGELAHLNCTIFTTFFPKKYPKSVVLAGHLLCSAQSDVGVTALVVRK